MQREFLGFKRLKQAGNSNVPKLSLTFICCDRVEGSILNENGKMYADWEDQNDYARVILIFTLLSYKILIQIREIHFLLQATTWSQHLSSDHTSARCWDTTRSQCCGTLSTGMQSAWWVWNCSEGAVTSFDFAYLYYFVTKTLVFLHLEHKWFYALSGRLRYC